MERSIWMELVGFYSLAFGGLPPSSLINAWSFKLYNQRGYIQSEGLGVEGRRDLPRKKK